MKQTQGNTYLLSPCTEVCVELLLERKVSSLSSRPVTSINIEDKPGELRQYTAGQEVLTMP
jgi:hypothetical protein